MHPSNALMENRKRLNVKLKNLIPNPTFLKCLLILRCPDEEDEFKEFTLTSYEILWE